MKFADRVEAGNMLAEKLTKYRNRPAVIYALPRGGVVLGAALAEKLDLPLDLIIPRKIGHPGQPEYAIGAVTEDGQVILNYEESSRQDPGWLKDAVLKQVEEAARRRKLYTKGRPKIKTPGKIAIIVDDGIATGLTVQAALSDIKSKEPSKIVLAIPVLPSDVARKLADQVDEIIALDTPRFYAGSVGAYYEEFEQVEDNEVIELLKKLMD